jgi:hypothetical protein
VCFAAGSWKCHSVAGDMPVPFSLHALDAVEKRALPLFPFRAPVLGVGPELDAGANPFESQTFSEIQARSKPGVEPSFVLMNRLPFGAGRVNLFGEQILFTRLAVCTNDSCTGPNFANR